MSAFRSRLARQGIHCEQVMPVPVIPILAIARTAPKPMYPLALPFHPQQELVTPPAVVPMEIGEYPPNGFATPGTILSNKTGFMPPGYLVCDGSEVSRTQYAALFAVIGTYYGEGDHYSTFHLPNLQNDCDPIAIYIIKYDMTPTSCPTDCTSSDPAPSPTITTGITGITGPSGQDGPTGPSGQDNIIGQDGATGPSGQDGATGPSGQDGQDGQDGATGPSGQDGQDGQDGATGPMGLMGLMGPTGPAGPVYYVTSNGITGSYGEGTGPPPPDQASYINPDSVPLQIMPYPLGYIPSPGTILYNTFNFLPQGYLPCDGAEIQRASYSYLFDMIGEYYGNGDGVTTFHVPLLVNESMPSYRYIIRYDVQHIPCVILEPDLKLNAFDISNSSITIT